MVLIDRLKVSARAFKLVILVWMLISLSATIISTLAEQTDIGIIPNLFSVWFNLSKRIVRIEEVNSLPNEVRWVTVANGRLNQIPLLIFSVNKTESTRHGPNREYHESYLYYIVENKESQGYLILKRYIGKAEQHESAIDDVYEQPGKTRAVPELTDLQGYFVEMKDEDPEVRGAIGQYLGYLNKDKEKPQRYVLVYGGRPKFLTILLAYLFFVGTAVLVVCYFKLSPNKLFNEFKVDFDRTGIELGSKYPFTIHICTNGKVRILQANASIICQKRMQEGYAKGAKFPQKNAYEDNRILAKELILKPKDKKTLSVVFDIPQNLLHSFKSAYHRVTWIVKYNIAIENFLDITGSSKIRVVPSSLGRPFKITVNRYSPGPIDVSPNTEILFNVTVDKSSDELKNVKKVEASLVRKITGGNPEHRAIDKRVIKTERLISKNTIPVTLKLPSDALLSYEGKLFSVSWNLELSFNGPLAPDRKEEIPVRVVPIQ